MRKNFIFKTHFHFASLMEPYSPFNDGKEYYGFACDPDDIPEEMRAMVPKLIERARSKEPALLSLRTVHRPSLYDMTEDNSDMNKMWLRLHDYNVSLDSLLRGQPCDVMVDMFEKTKGHSRHISDRFGCSLRAVRFDAKLLDPKKWKELVESVSE